MHFQDFKTGLTHSKTKVIFFISLPLYIINLNLISFAFSLPVKKQLFDALSERLSTIWVTFLTHNGSPCVPEEPSSVKWSIHHSTQSASLYMSYSTDSICRRPVGLLVLRADQRSHGYRALRAKWLSISLSNLCSNATLSVSSTLATLIKIDHPQ